MRARPPPGPDAHRPPRTPTHTVPGRTALIMAIREVSITITGRTPLLMHKFPMQPIEAIEKKSIEEQAEYSAYRDPDSGELYIPGVNLQRGLVAAAVYSKG